MVSGTTLREAIGIKARFLNPIWGSTSRMACVEHGENLELHIDELWRDDTENFILTCWVLSITACQLEFLVGRKLPSLAATMQHRRHLSTDLARFFLPRRTHYRARRSAIRISAVDLDSPVAVTVAQIPAFLASLMRDSVDAQMDSDICQRVKSSVARKLPATAHPTQTCRL